MRLFILLGIAMFVCAAPAVAESLTMTTYYPAPSGKYQELTVAGNVVVGTTDEATESLMVAGTVQAERFEATKCISLTYGPNTATTPCPEAYPRHCAALDMPPNTADISGLMACCLSSVDCDDM
jgi:hypothetical protein